MTPRAVRNSTAEPAAPRRARSIVTPNFGEQLRKLRGDQSRGDVCRALAAFGLNVERSTLLHYERGCVAAPDPAILWALGRHYGLDSIDELLTVLVMDRTGKRLRAGVDIARPGFDLQQRRVAESFGALAPTMKDAVALIIGGINGAALDAAPRPRKRA
jgi:hypothetical protein